MKNGGMFKEKVGNVTFTVKIKPSDDAKLSLEELVKKIISEKSVCFKTI